MPGRKYTATSSYRYGFNGKENDNEVKGTGNQQDYGLRIYDPRIGRFLSIDPLAKKFAMLTPYQFAGNSPILNIDLDGAEKLGRNGTNPAYPVQNVVNNVAIVRIITNIFIQGSNVPLPPGTQVTDIEGTVYQTQTRDEPGNAPGSGRIYNAKQDIIVEFIID